MNPQEDRDGRLIEFLPRDEHMVEATLFAPREKVVLLQSLVESYEGLAVVRTKERDESVVTILATPSTADDCRALLSSLHPLLGWTTKPLDEASSERVPAPEKDDQC